MQVRHTTAVSSALLHVPLPLLWCWFSMPLHLTLCHPPQTLPLDPAVLVSPGNAIGCACLAAMAALCANGTCSEEEAARVGAAVRRVRQSPGLPLALRHAALAAALHLAAARRGPVAAVQLALAGVTGSTTSRGQQQLALPVPASAVVVLEEAAQIVAAAADASAAVQRQQLVAAGAAPIAAPMPLLQQLASLLNAGQDCRLRHLAFLLLQLLSVQPPTLYRPPTNEAEEDAAAFFSAAAAAAAGGQAGSMGVTHRTGQQQQASGAAALPAQKIRLQLGGGGGARSMAISGKLEACAAAAATGSSHSRLTL